MDPLIYSGILGGIGGAVRGIVGLFKALSRRQKIIWRYFASTCLFAIAIGAFTGTILSYNPQVSLLAGYTGTDIIEGVIKAFKGQKSLFK